jgi:serine/threonine protein kinase/tetratricopeptide (TPR) repeat protein
MPDRWERIKAIFSEASELPKGERSAYLDQSCADDAKLRAEVEKLLEQLGETESDGIFDAPRQHSLAPGELIGGRFRIVRFVGEGGMGEVYEAEDGELRGSVALKVLRPELAGDPDFLNRFRREVLLARQVTHPNICRVFDLGFDRQSASPRVFLTMEFLDGETLSRRLRQGGRMTQEAALPLIRQMGAGLTALHEQGIVHRDFKPGNVMVVRSASGAERAVINDFGLARALEAPEGMTVTRASHVIGTPDYMAPEQLLGKSATRASDIYALGVVLHEMLTGKKPATPREKSEGTSARWNKVIGRCLEADPANRPGSAAEVVAALEGGTLRPLPGAWTKKKWMAPAALAILLAGIPAGQRYRDWSANRAGISNEQQQHLALLPLKTLTDDPALRIFAEGLMETITSRMSQFEQGKAPLTVVPASEVRSQGTTTAGDARKKFQVDAAVEGSLEARGDRLRLLLTLVDTKTMRQVETITVDEARSDSWKLQDSAVNKLANTLNVRLQSKYAKEQQEMSPMAPGAYEFYLQARGYLQRSDQPQSVASAITLLKRAIELDPKFALAYSALGRAYGHEYSYTRDPKSMDAAIVSGSKALRLNPELPETNVAMGLIYYQTNRYPEARERFAKAIELDPKSHEAYQGLAKAYTGLRDYPRAEATYLKAISLRKDDWTGYKSLGLFYYDREDYRKAVAQLQKVVELTPDNGEGFLNLGAAQSGAQDWEGAEKSWRRVLEIDPKDGAALSNLGTIYLNRLHQPSKAAELFRRALALNGRNYRAWGALGRAYRSAGERTKAQEAFDKTLALIDDELLIEPKSPGLASALAFYRALAGRKDFAPALERALQLAPDRAETLLRAAETCVIAGNRPRAAELLDKALSGGASPQAVERSEFLKDLKPEAQARK